jgi:hypothetical protein
MRLAACMALLAWRFDRWDQHGITLTVGYDAPAGTELAAKSAWTGLATGIFHTLCGPDHLAVRRTGGAG